MFASLKENLSKTASFITRRYSPAIITLFVLAGFYFFYFTVVVNKNEANLKERKFRGLQRMGDNISKKISSYVEQNGTNFLMAMNNSHAAPAIQSFNEEQYHLKSFKLDTSVEDNPPFLIRFIDNWDLLFNNHLIKETWSKDSVVAAAGMESFITPLLRRDFFRHYYLAIGDTILLDELNSSFNTVSSYLTGNTTIDSVKKGPLIQTGEIRKIEIGGKEYRLFLLPFIVEGRYRFTLGGYMPAGDYTSEQRYIPIYGILWMVIGIMLVILMFPLLKVFLMHRTEQLVARNAISSLGSIHILGSMLVLIALSTYAYFAVVRSGVDVNLKNLATGIDRVFNQEVNAALHVLDSAEERLSNDTSSSSSLDKENDNHYNYPPFRHITWADSAGMQQIRWTTDPYPSQKIDIKDRDYFLAVKKGNLWRRGNEPPFYLTGIASRVENKNLAIISRPVSKRNKAGKTDAMKLMMISVSGPLRSLFNTILPFGTSFCIIKDNGDVLFHSDEKRNLNENLVEECNNSKALQYLLKQKSAGFIGSVYSGNIHRFYVRPVKGMPYFIVTFRDMRSLWSEDLDVISSCSIFILMNLGVILIAILIIQVTGYRRSLLQHKSILFPWLQPNRNLVTAYKSVTAVYITAIIFQITISAFYREQDQLCLTGILFSYSFCLIGYAYYQFAVLNPAAGEVTERKFKILSVILVLAWIVAGILFILYLVKNGHGWFVFLVSQVSLGLVMLFVYILKRTTLSQNRFEKFCQEKVTSLLGKKIALFSNLMSPFRRSLGTVERGKEYRWWYITSVFVFIIATAIVPAILFYCMSYKQERLLSLKRNQLEFASKLTDQPRFNLKPLQWSTAIDTGNSIKNSYSTPFYFNSFADSITKSACICLKGDSSINNFELFYNRIKPSFSANSTQLEYLKNGDSSNNDYKWTYLKAEKQLLLHYNITQTNTYLDSSRAICVYSPAESGLDWIRKAIQRDWISFLLFLATLVLMGIGFFFLLKRLIAKIFFDGYNDSEYFDTFDENNLFIRSFPDEEHLFVNGLINSGKHNAVYQYFKQEKKANVEVVDIARLSTEEFTKILENLPANFTEEKNEEPGTPKDIVLVRHFEMFMDDIKMTEAKLNLLEWLLRRKQIRIIILSSRSFESMVKRTSPDDKDQAKDFTDRCINMMNRFYNVYYQWQKPADKTGDINLTKRKEELNAYCNLQISNQHKNGDPSKEVQKYSAMQLERFFEKLDMECNGSDILRQLRQSLLDYLDKNREKCFGFDFRFKNNIHMIKIINRHFISLYENICLRIQSLASNYYLSVWQSLSEDEQVTLYDIAMDELVNPANRDIASRLASLGLVKRPKDVPGYQILSKSFRNFIFTRIDKDDVKNLRNENIENASWTNFQLPILIVVVALGIFLFTTQEGAFTNLITYLGATIGGIGALLRVLGMIPSSSSG